MSPQVVSLEEGDTLTPPARVQEGVCCGVTGCWYLTWVFWMTWNALYLFILNKMIILWKKFLIFVIQIEQLWVKTAEASTFLDSGKNYWSLANIEFTAVVLIFGGRPLEAYKCQRKYACTTLQSGITLSLSVTDIYRSWKECFWRCTTCHKAVYTGSSIWLKTIQRLQG